MSYLKSKHFDIAVKYRKAYCEWNVKNTQLCTKSHTFSYIYQSHYGYSLNIMKTRMLSILPPTSSLLPSGISATASSVEL